MKIQNLFTSGKMNKDLDERLIPQGEYRNGLNIKSANSTGSDVGALENALSNEAKSTLDLGANAVTLGAVSDDEDRVVYWFVKSDTGCHICRYDQKNDVSDILMSDTRNLTNDDPKHNVLNFNEAHMIQANVLTDADNLKKFIYFTDGFNPPRRINVGTAEKYEVSGFEHEDINVIVKPPLFPPSIKFMKSNDEENNIEDKFLMFGYRYVYEDGEKSSISPFSKTAFSPKLFSYDFVGAINKSMVNEFNSVDITYDSGSHLVREVEIVFKESGNNNVYIATNIVKKDKSLSDNTKYEYTFKNNSIYKVLPEDEIFRLYDNVPKVAESQDIISNRLVYGNYKENYDLVDVDGNETTLDLSASYNSNYFTGRGEETARSNMDYEIGIAYLDEYGRSTTVITSDNNSVHVPAVNSIQKNKLVATINSLAPKFASYYRFYVKQSKLNDYEILSPLKIYNDGDSYWVRLEGDDKNKIEKNNTVTVKADVRGVKKNIVKAKVLDLAVKEKNFLEDSGYTGSIEQEAGYYMKIASVGIDLEEINYTKVTGFDSDNSKDSYDTNFTGRNTYYHEGPFPLNSNTGENDLSVSGTYNGLGDKRFEVRIDSIGTTDQFVWRAYSVEDNSKPQYSATPINCSTSSISLQDGMSISFGAVTGHSVGDVWSFNAKGDLAQYYAPVQDGTRSYITLKTFDAGSEIENITPGTTFSFSYQEYKGVNSKVLGLQVDGSMNSTESYANIEEWYWGEGRSQFIELGFNVNDKIRFRRGQYSDNTKSNNTFAITGSYSDPLCLMIQSDLAKDGVFGGRNVYSVADMSIFKREASTYIVMETIPSENNSDVFYEVPGTYAINDCGYHTGLTTGDVDQGFDQPAVIEIDFVNAYTFGNGFECYKINDSFIANKLDVTNRPLTYVENYRENHRNASITYSDVYEQSTNYNGLNEFNLSRVNYIDLDDEYGDVKRVHSRDTNLVVFQENKVSYLPYQKSILYNADGSGNVAQSINVFGNQVPYAGEYGISSSPHSFSTWGNSINFCDERRGAVLRLSADGLTEISQYGMRDWFRDNLNAKNNKVTIGGYDPFNGQYVVSIKNPVSEWREDEYECDKASCDLEAVISKAPTTTTTTTSSTTSTTTSSTTSTTTTTTATPVSSFTIYANPSSGTTPLQGFSTSTAACQGTAIPVTVYNSFGDTSVEQSYNNGHALYEDQALTTLYNGGNTYFKEGYSGGNSFQVGTNGFIFTFTSC